MDNTCVMCGAVIPEGRQVCLQCEWANEIRSNQKGTLCWTCRIPGTGGCSWDKKLEPVPGWTATKTMLMVGKRIGRKAGTREPSYCVHSCPLYQPMDLSSRLASYGYIRLTEEELLYCIQEGMTDEEISEFYGVTYSTVVSRRAILERKRREQE